jgi:hypothetical protein
LSLEQALVSRATSSARGSERPGISSGMLGRGSVLKHNIVNRDESQDRT